MHKGLTYLRSWWCNDFGLRWRCSYGRNLTRSRYANTGTATSPGLHHQSSPLNTQTLPIQRTPTSSQSSSLSTLVSLRAAILQSNNPPSGVQLHCKRADSIIPVHPAPWPNSKRVVRSLLHDQPTFLRNPTYTAAPRLAGLFRKMNIPDRWLFGQVPRPPLPRPIAH